MAEYAAPTFGSLPFLPPIDTSLPKPTLYDSPRPRLRSCLSPSRSSSTAPSLADTLPTPSASRSTSFSSCTSATGEWKTTKCVRWQEMNGCAVTSTHDTYSHEEYDRTPLEPPTQAERACVLPERGSRCLSAARDCFLSDSLDDLAGNAEGVEYLSISEQASTDSYFLRTPPPTEDCSENGSDDGETGQGEDAEWEECMERRRMMFARMCPILGAGGNGNELNDRHPEFEGYRSISATLAQLLKSVGCQEDEEIPDVCTPDLAPVHEEEEMEEDEEDFVRKDCGFGFTSLKFGEFDSVPTQAAQEEEVESSFGTGADTPSLISSSGSEPECIIASPGGADSTIVPICGNTAEEVVMAAWTGPKVKLGLGREVDTSRLGRVA
ncbi:hypothetical protein IAU60_000700 [Kwoniella sp. DSM 27419]